MSKAAFDKIAEGLQEALAVAKGEAEPFATHNISISRIYFDGDLKVEAINPADFYALPLTK